MLTRVGIELSPTACRIVEVECSPTWRRDHRDTRVRSYAVLPAEGPETRQALAALSGRQAAVIVWGPATEHRQVVVRAGSYEAMRAEAVTSLAAAGIDTRGTLSDIAPLASTGDPKRRPMAVALASASAVQSRIQPVLDAGVRVRTVMTPPMALASLMRLRPSRLEPGAIEAYVALDETATFIALLRDGGLIVTRMLPWGYVDGLDGGQPRRREDVAMRLADELAEFFLAAGGSTASVRQVSICGGHPELRSMTVPLMEALDLEVEPLDSLFGIDATQLPGSSGEFQERVASLRAAWAVAADWPPPHNLLRAQNRRVSHVRLARVAVVAGVVAGWGLGWRIAGRPSWQHVEVAPVHRVASAQPLVAPAFRAVPPAPAQAIASPTADFTPTPVASAQPMAAVELPAPPIVRTEPPPVVRAEPPAPPIVRREPPPSTMMTSMSAALREPVPPSRRLVREVAPSRPGAEPPSDRTTPTAAFDAVLGTILYSADRRLAIIDGQIVGPGDDVHGVRVVDIGPSAVIIRDTQGQLRRLTLGADRR